MTEFVGDAAGATLGLTAMAMGETGIGPWLGGLAMIAPVAGDVLTRYMSHRQRARVETVLTLAKPIYANRIRNGDTPRGDGFFEREPSGRNAGEEAAEAVLNVARDSYEELKLPYIANLLVEISFEATLGPDVANRVIRLAEQLTWTQYVLLAAIERQESTTMPDMIIGEAKSWEAWSIGRQLIELRKQDLFGAINSKTPAGTEYPNWNLPDQRLMVGGRLLHQALGLGGIEQLYVASVWRSATAQ